MRCQWQSFLELLPTWIRNDVDRLGGNVLQELRLRVYTEPELVTGNGSLWLSRKVYKEDIDHCINMASRYSPWAADSISNGYLTAAGGHRIGLCGYAVMQQGVMKGVQTVTSLCMRVARDFPEIASRAPLNGSTLIIGSPGSGKTTLLRDLIRQISDRGSGSIAVLDERGEIFPYVQNRPCFPVGKKTDVLTGCLKTQGIDMLIRTMGPEVIAVDEITAVQDCEALLHAGWCGVRLIATAHAGSRAELFSREVYKPLIHSELFDNLIILHPNKSWKAERMRV